MTSGGYLLDTDYVIDLLKGKQYAPTLLEKLLTHLSTHSQAGLSISIITFAEVYEGIYRGYAQKEQEQAFLDFTRIVAVYGITRPGAKRYALIRGELAQQALSIDQPDFIHCSNSPPSRSHISYEQ